MSKVDCEGGYTGLFDMLGNVGEWEDSYDDGVCLVRGGDFSYSWAVINCTFRDYYARSAARSEFGIRCCSR